jgi:tetratricopeptide (TPR) repeat protein
MDKPGLKLIAPRREPAGRRGRACAALGLGAVLFASAALATVLGADSARRPIQARELAESALERSLNQGNRDPEVRSALLELRSTLSRRPLDSKTRAVYASLILGLSRRLEDSAVAAFHAGLAAELAPVTLSVVRPAVLILAYSGRPEKALELSTSIFAYDPQRAAATLAQIEPFLIERSAEDGLPYKPEAWLAWHHQLTLAGRTEEAELWLDRAYQHWPEHLRILERIAGRAAHRRDWQVLETLFPAERELPQERAAARPILHRAKLRAFKGDLEAAQDDIQRALGLDGQSGSTQILAGDAYETMGEYGPARDQWTRALYGLAPDNDDVREQVLRRLARLEDRHGEPAAALRLWQALLEIDPDNAEAKGRVDDLSGFRR